MLHLEAVWTGSGPVGRLEAVTSGQCDTGQGCLFVCGLRLTVLFCKGSRLYMCVYYACTVFKIHNVVLPSTLLVSP